VFFAFLISVYSVSLLPRISNGFLKLLFSTPPFTVEPNRVFYHYVVLTLIWLWVGLSLRVKPAPRRQNLVFLSVVAVFSTFAIEFILLKGNNPLTILTFSVYEWSFPLVISLTYLATRRKSTAVSMSAIFVAFIVLSLMHFPISMIVDKRPWWVIVRAPRWLMVASMLLLEYKAKLHQQDRLETLTYFFSPLNMVFPVPVRARDWAATGTKENQIQGLLNIVFGLTLGWIASILYKSSLDVTEPLLDTLLIGLRYYLFLFTMSYSGIVTCIGWVQWLGFRLPDAFELPLLAATPQDRWRTWNTYFYHYFYTLLFLPIFRKTKSLWLGIFVTFAVTAAFHFGAVWTHLFAFDLRALLSHKAAYLLYFFLLHGVVVYFGIRTQRFWPKATRRAGWAGVALTWILMILVHATRRLDR
jgi:hypothetical protein